MAFVQIVNNMTLLLIICINFAISLLSLIGLSITAYKQLKKSQLTSIFISFSAGTLIATAFINMISEALHEGGEEIIFYTLVGIIFSFLMERTMVWYHHHHDDTHNIKPTGPLVLFGDAIHNFIDGVAIAATAVVSPIAALSASIGIAAHEIPQEFADFMILIHAGYTRKKALFFNFLSAFTSVVGGIVGYFFLQTIDEALPVALAFSAGTFIYIAAADLIPSLHEKQHSRNAVVQTVSFLTGIILIFFISSIFAHAH